MTAERIRDFGYALAGLTLVAAPVFYVAEGSSIVGFARVTAPVLGVLLIVTGLGAVATTRQAAAPAAAASAVAIAAALLQLGQTGHQSNLLAGNGSTFSLLLGVALGWLGLAVALRAQVAAGGPAGRTT